MIEGQLHYLLLCSFRYVLPRETCMVDVVQNEICRKENMEHVALHVRTYLRELEEEYGAWRRAHGSYPNGWERVYEHLKRI